MPAAPSPTSALQRGSGLRYVNDRMPGLVRRRAGRGFCYRDAHGRRICDAEALQRVAALAIPPAYRHVWICADPRGHLQATGIDARGRKQYRYHPQWRLLRDAQKFERMIEFAEALPRLRRRVRRDLALSGLPQDKVVALIVALLDTTRVRIGNIEYARSNGSFGLTTLRNRHVDFVRNGRLRLRFVGKGGAEHEITIDDRRLARIVRRCQQLPGQALFQYLDEDGQRHAVDSTLVNAYLQDVGGAPFTAKDFRTWHATLSALALLSDTPLPTRGGERAYQRCINEVIRQVALDLRNTAAVCRKSYINPVVFELWRAGRLTTAVNLRAAPRKAEQIALKLLRRQRAACRKR